MTAILESENIACIVSGGHGYIIDVDKKSKIKDIDCDVIISLASDDRSSSFIISTYWDIQRIDNNLNQTEISLPMQIQADGIYFTDKHDGIQNLEIEEVGPGLNRNKNYYIDLNDWIVKKHSA